jgi:hypothetical protein
MVRWMKKDGRGAGEGRAAEERCEAGEGITTPSGRGDNLAHQTPWILVHKQLTSSSQVVGFVPSYTFHACLQFPSMH